MGGRGVLRRHGTSGTNYGKHTYTTTKIIAILDLGRIAYFIWYVGYESECRMLAPGGAARSRRSAIHWIEKPAPDGLK